MITLTLTESHYQTVLNALRIAGDTCRDSSRVTSDAVIRSGFLQASKAYETVHELIEEFAEKQT
jgi:hypothetical protein